MNIAGDGEIIKPSSPLIREQFDKNNAEQAANPKNVKVGAIKNIIYHAINDSGLREKKNVIKGQKREKNRIELARKVQTCSTYEYISYLEMCADCELYIKKWLKSVGETMTRAYST